MGTGWWLKKLVRRGPQHVQNETSKKWTCSKKYFDVFGLLSKLRACSVSVVASGICFIWGNQFVSSKAVRRSPGSPTLMYVW